MPEATDPQLQDIATLAKAVETVLRKMIRFLVGRMTLVKLQEMIRTIYVEEAEMHMASRHPGRNVPLTELALLSGLDTRTLIKVRNDAQYRKPFHAKNAFLRDLNPGAAILDMWNSKEPFFDRTANSARPLAVSGSDASFETLFHEAVKSRGITARSLLTRLLESGSVRLDDATGEISLVEVSYLPATTGDEAGSIEMGFSAIANLVETVAHNVHALRDGGDRMYQRGAWTYRLPLHHRAEARTRLAQLLAETDSAARIILQELEAPEPTSSQVTAGVSAFYFEDHEAV